MSHKVKDWIKKMQDLMQPKEVYICNGSKEEFDLLAEKLVQEKIFISLSKRPHSFLALSDPLDVARVEERTFICSKSKQDAGPTNHWVEPRKMHEELSHLFSGCMKGRVMYVIPFCMGEKVIGIQVTDSAYVVCNMHIMTKVSPDFLESENFIPCQHSVGKSDNKLWPCDPKNVTIAHFPEEKYIASYGSGYGGNALLGKKCLALRIASVMEKEEGWLAEHMLIIKLTNPEGRSKHIAGAFPSSCGKTNLAMLSATLKGWRVECVGDDIAWMRIGKDGRLYATNPESGFFGVAPGTSFHSNPNCMKTIEKNTIFTNVALTKEGDVWWEGMTKEVPELAMDWKRNPYTGKEKAAHPNSRFTAPFKQCPISIEGEVPIDAIIFGGRRKQTIPLVYRAISWDHGVFIGASLSSETTAAAKGATGQLRHDPFAMLPFCGYHMGDYFKHWLNFKRYTEESKLPNIFGVNWFLQDSQGNYLWPGFGENSRVLEWIFSECDGGENHIESPIGYLPKELNIEGLSIDLQKLLEVNPFLWEKELDEIADYFLLFGEKLPKELSEQIARIKSSFLDFV